MTTPKSAATANKATLYMAAPDHTKATGLWFVQQQSAATTFPNAAAPAPLTGPGFANPLVTAAAADGNLTNFLASAVLDSTAGYANIIQIRVKDSGPGGVGSGTKYWETNIAYTITDPVAGTGTWTVNDPSTQATTTTLAANPPSPQTSPASPVTLTATVAPASAGTVTFFEGATNLGGSTVSGGVASLNIGAPALGNHAYTAVFTPDGGTLVTGSTSSVLNYHVGAPAIGTTTTLAVNTGTGQAFSPVTFTANVTTADSSTTTGTVTFMDGATTIGTTPSASTSAPFVLVNSSLGQGPHSVTATFTPDTADYNPSTSAPQAFDLTAPPCAGGGTGCVDTQNIQADIPAGTIVVNTPYHAGNPLDVPLNLDPTASYYTGSATFQNIQVTDTRAGDLPWDLKAQSSSLVFGANAINGQNVGLTNWAITGTPTVSTAAGNVTTTDAPAATPPVGPADPGTLGLGNAQHTIVHANLGLGTIAFDAKLTINAPTNLPAGTYTGTITFTVG